MSFWRTADAETHLYLFSHLADAFIQIDLNRQMRTLQKQSKPTKEQQHASAITSHGKPNTVHVGRFFVSFDF